MTDITGVPSPRSRVVLKDISAVSWEHPADRAALQTLRSLPGFDQVVKKIVGFFGERGIRLFFQANAIRVGPTQFPKIHALITEVNATMDWPKQPEVFVTQTPIVNAGALGVDEPFVLLNSGALELLNEDETRVLIGHELGHIMSGHSLYRTIAIILLALGFNNLPFLAGIALLPIQLALLEWFRKSELSADRAGLLASQDPKAAMRVFLKLAGGADTRGIAPLLEEVDLEAYMEQAREYEEAGGLDIVYKILNSLGMTHPFHTLRAGQLQRWIDDGHYERMLGGEYTHRGAEEEQRPLRDDLGEAAQHYAKEAKQTVSSVADAAKRAASAFTETLRKKATGKE